SSSRARSRSSSRAAGRSRVSTAPSSGRSRAVPRRPEPLLVLGILGQYPMAGVSWQAIHYLRGFHQLGWDVWYVEDSGAPPYDPLRIAAGEESSLGFLASHDVLFTYGENLGAADCPVPLERFAWRTTRPPVVLDCWAPRTDPGAVFFTSIASWENKGKNITFRGETYQWSKHVNFLRFLDLPRHTPQRFCLAMDPADAAVEARVRGAGWELVDPRPISADIDAYRDFIYGSRGEFTVAKDIYVRPRSGWFSDRSVCYLAAGKP